MTNIELFDEYVARILARLYETFPVKARIDARELSGHHEIDDFGAIVDEAGRPSRKFEIARATIQWLVDTGYVRATDSHNVGFHDAVLTAEGLKLLKSEPPESLQSKTSIGDRIVRFVREGSIHLARETASAAITLGAGMIR